MLPILIVGAGPTGLTLACELLRQNIPFRIIDKERAISDLSKAIAVQARTLELFERFDGLSELLINQGVKIERGVISTAKKQLTEIKLGEISSRYPFVLSIPQPDTERSLRKRLESAGVIIELNTTLINFSQNSESVTVTLNHADQKIETLETPWLIACDGAHSTIRQELNLSFKGSTFTDEIFVLADVTLNQSFPPEQVTVYWLNGAILALFPLPNNHFRIIAERPKSFQTFDIQQLEMLVQQTIHPQLKFVQVFWFSEFRVNQRKVENYQSGRIFLAGDAAHIHSPVGGQGMNTGMHDAINLGWKLAAVIKNKAQEKILETYTSERGLVGDELLSNTDKATRMVMLRNPFLIKLRNWFVGWITKHANVQHSIINNISELAVNYRNTGLSEQHFLANTGVVAGDRWPDAKVNLAQQDKRWYELFSYNDFNILIVDANNEILAEFEPILKPYHQQLKYFLLTENTFNIVSSLSYITIIDSNKTLMKQLSQDSPAIYIIRPDFYVAYRANPIELNALKDYLEHWLISA